MYWWGVTGNTNTELQQDEYFCLFYCLALIFPSFPIKHRKNKIISHWNLCKWMRTHSSRHRDISSSVIERALGGSGEELKGEQWQRKEQKGKRRMGGSVGWLRGPGPRVHAELPLDILNQCRESLAVARATDFLLEYELNVLFVNTILPLR